MSKQSYAPSIKGRTPMGIAKFPKLNAPDDHFCEGPNDVPVYQTTLLLTPEEAEPLIEQLDKLYEENYAFQCEKTGKSKLKKADKPYRNEEDHETGEPTGMIEFRFKLKSRVTSKRSGVTTEKKPLLVDRFGKPFTLEVTGGSLIVVNYEAYGYYAASIGAGITMKCLAVQIREHRDWGGAPQTAEDAGFEIDECDDAVADDSFEVEGETVGATEF